LNTLMKNAHRFDDYISNHFSHIYGGNIEQTFIKRYYLWKSYLANVLLADKQMPILEVGCGMGHNLYSLTRLGYTDVTGFDISRECVNYCTKQGLKAVYYQTENELINKWVQNKKFSLIVIYDVIEHYTPDEAKTILLRLKRILAKGGIILISVPNAAYPLNTNLYYSDITHHFMYNELSMGQLLSQSGMKPIRYVYSNSFALYDENIVLHFVKRFIMKPISSIGEFCWKILALSQGVTGNNMKPTMYCFAEGKE
jgi:2-polyprenyl-3-methyl-5-hydroxy-6-metoxy-1,4-benzoquinol methylase